MNTQNRKSLVQTFTCAALLLLCAACAKAPSAPDVTPPAVHATHGSMARLTLAGNSRSIPVDTANMMLNSYLRSVGYPSVDTAVRSLSFDADTLRAYLQNPDIVSIKFMLAHQPAYASGSSSGSYAGMNPGALTIIIVGLDDNENCVLNSRNEVYDHFTPCPNYCPNQIGDVYIH